MWKRLLVRLGLRQPPPEPSFADLVRAVVQGQEFAREALKHNAFAKHLAQMETDEIREAAMRADDLTPPRPRLTAWAQYMRELKEKERKQ